MVKLNYYREVLFISIIILITSIKSINQWSEFPIGNDFFWWLVQILFYYMVIKIKSKVFKNVANKQLIYIDLFLYWVLICTIRGVLLAENYWEWKNLIATTFVLFLPIVVYIISSLQLTQQILKFWFKYWYFLFIPILPFLRGEAIGRILIPFTFLIIFFPIINRKWKIISIAVLLFVITFDISARSNIIKFIMPFTMTFLYYFRFFLTNKVLKSIRLILIISPFFFLILGLMNIFNVFKLNEYLGEYNAEVIDKAGKLKEEELTADTRTFLYIEVLESAVKNNYVFFGRTHARGNDSFSFGDYNKFVLNTGKSERFSNEVSILNIFTWLGVFGVVLYFMIFLKSSYLAIYESENIFVKLIGITVSFRWAFAWVEDFSQFDLSNIFLWLMIGLCFSKSFRRLTDKQVKLWIRGIFDMRYAKLSHLLIARPIKKNT